MLPIVNATSELSLWLTLVAVTTTGLVVPATKEGMATVALVELVSCMVLSPGDTACMVIFICFGGPLTMPVS